MNRLEKLQYALGFTLLNFLGLGVVPNLVSEYVKAYYASALVAFMVLGLAYVLVGLISRAVARRARASIAMVQSENLSPREGLIVLSSPGSRTTPAENAIKAHLGTLQHCWIIAGPDVPGIRPSSADNARSLIEHYQTLRPTIRFHPRELDDEHNPEKAFHLVESIYREARAFGLTEHNMIADYTGGTKSMTAGMVLACSASEDRDAQYMKPKQVEPTGIATQTAEATPILVDLWFGGRS